MNIDITEFWIKRVTCYNEYRHFTINSNWFNANATGKFHGLGKGRGYIWSDNSFYQLAVIVQDDTIFIDFAFPEVRNTIEQQVWILKHVENKDYKIEFVSIWEKFNLPSVEELNNFGQLLKQELLNESSPVIQPQVQNAAQDLYNDSLQILLEASGMDETTILPEEGEDLNTYINSINRLLEEVQDINRHATIVYNHHRNAT